MAGLWDRWRGPGGQRLGSFTIIGTSSSRIWRSDWWRACLKRKGKVGPAERNRLSDNT